MMASYYRLLTYELRLYMDSVLYMVFFHLFIYFDYHHMGLCCADKHLLPCKRVAQ